MTVDGRMNDALMKLRPTEDHEEIQALKGSICQYIKLNRTKNFRIYE